MKIVLNRSTGPRISLSALAIDRLSRLKGSAELTSTKTPRVTNVLYSLPRNDRDLVHIVEELGAAASDHDAELQVFEIPDDVSWRISDVAGYEYIVVHDKVYLP